MTYFLTKPSSYSMRISLICFTLVFLLAQACLLVAQREEMLIEKLVEKQSL